MERYRNCSFPVPQKNKCGDFDSDQKIDIEKEETTEILTESTYRAFIILGVLGAILSIIGIVLFFIVDKWKKQVKKIRRLQKKAQEEFGDNEYLGGDFAPESTKTDLEVNSNRYSIPRLNR
ncbi:unnamed protein product [Dimorphilus gyrociliatus]|uniref:Uncharacterized protein n=1 Tax=Dimorphilus gyrociliatus TaxID=2664684 RepID=A0A7I8VRR4_9ANNE|nr:unnamed protein product [Dimorphilus gyrociliatus]